MKSERRVADPVDHARRVAAERPVDVVPRWTAFLRTLYPLRVIADKALRGPYTRDAFIDETTAVHRRAAASHDIKDKSVGLWQMEKLGFSYCRHGDNTLRDAAIPIAIQPISHVGLGIAATESGEFSARKIIDLIEPRAHPDYRLFAYESIGCIWAVYADRWYRRVFRFVSQVQMPSYTLPVWSEFVDAFSPDIQWLVSHGYGRTLYFKDYDVGRAIRRAAGLESVDTAAAVHGIAFAYAMLNYQDLHRVLDVGRDLRDQAIAQAFRSGLVYALAFWEWAFEGFFDSLAPGSDHQQGLIAQAREVMAESRRLGRFTVFGLG